MRQQVHERTNVRSSNNCALVQVFALQCALKPVVDIEVRVHNSSTTIQSQEQALEGGALFAVR